MFKVSPKRKLSKMVCLCAFFKSSLNALMFSIMFDSEVHYNSRHNAYGVLVMCRRDRTQEHVINVAVKSGAIEVIDNRSRESVG